MKYLEKINADNIPNHIAIIMDGNGRWAKSQNLPRTDGHKEGVERLREILEAAGNLGVKVLTVYAFSTENWKRPKTEVNFLMKMIVDYLYKESKSLTKNNIKLQFLGKREQVPSNVKLAMNAAENMSKKNDGMIFNVALNYGGRSEIVEAIKQITRDVDSNKLDLDLIDENIVKKYLYTKDIPDPDLLIRTSGEVRLSNFLLYQIAYSELIFEDIYWPEYTKEYLYKNIVDFQNRKRRYGNI